MIKSKAIEVGNIFSLGNKFSDPLELYFTDKTGKQKPIFMGSYGIGLTRLMGTVAEILSDEKGLVWPENIAPFRVIICRLGGDKEVARVADELYDNMQEQGIEVMYDDRDVRPGEKFTDADLLGIPHRVVISAKTVEAGRIEYKKRTENNASMISVDELNKVLAQTQ